MMDFPRNQVGLSEGENQENWEYLPRKPVYD